MLFFDFKIILILSLTIVIYFIYREIEFMHLRISTLEYKTQKKQTNDMCTFDTTKFMPVVTIVPSTKNIVVDTSETKPDINYIINNKVTNLQTISDSPKFVEIYSNDNSSPTLDNDNDNENEKDNENDKNDKNDKNDNLILEDTSPDIDIKIDSGTTFDYKINDEKNEKTINYTEEQLKNMKLLDISNIATTHNIQLTKSINGVVKKKLKQDLINEIISKKNI
jgi:hypothetical protein